MDPDARTRHGYRGADGRHSLEHGEKWLPLRGVDQAADPRPSTSPWGSRAAVAIPAFGPHAALGGAAALCVLCEALVVDTGRGYWLALAATFATAALVFAWRRQDELRFAPILAIAAAYQLAVVAAHVAGGVLGDQDVAAYGVYGSELIDGRFPQTEYPAGGVLLFGLEALLGNGSAITPNRLLMMPFQLLCVAGVWGLHTRHSRWLAAVLAIWPMSVFYWEYRFDLAAAGLLALGLLLAYQGRWGWSGAALGAGTLAKWSPGLSFLFLAVWLVAGRRWTELRRLSASFVVVLLVHVPLLFWDAGNVVNPYTAQGGRAITNESVWYFPLRILGLTGGGAGAEWEPAGAPQAADVVVVLVQATLMALLAWAVVSVRASNRLGVAVAALAPAIFLLTNRVFSPQFMLVVAVAVLFACALTARSREEQLLVGLLAMGATFANAFVYPYANALFNLSWTPASATVYLLMLPAVLVVLRSTLTERTEVEGNTWYAERIPDFGFRDVAAVLSSRSGAVDSAQPIVPPWSRRVLGPATAVVTAVFLGAAAFVAVVLPFRYWDSLAFGSWPRSIAEGHGLWDNASAFALSRPVVYVPEGLAWRFIDDGDWVGRVYSLLFSAALVAAVWLLAGRLPKRPDARLVTRSLSVGILLGSAVFTGLVAASMTDIPVAAGSAATALVLWRPPTRWLLPVVAVLCAATVLSKSTGLLALAGIALAVTILNGRRSVPGLVAMASGIALALSYDAWQASRIGRSLTDFLSAGNEQYWLDRGAAARWDALARAEWLGPSIRLVIVYGLLHGLARAVGARPRIALAVAAVGAVTWSVVGPLAADGGTFYPFDGSVLGLVAWLVLAAAIGSAPFLALDDPIDRRVHVALLVWLAPTTVVWAYARADEVRHLAPAWAPLVLLSAAALASVSVALARLRPAAFVVPALAVLLLAVTTAPSIDGLGRSGWRGLLDLGWSGWTDRAQTENYAWGPFSYVVNLTRENVTGSQRIVTSDGRLQYFFPGQVEVSYARTCSELEGARFFSLLTSGESLAFAQSEQQPTNPIAWTECTQPRVRLVGEQPGIYAAFVIGRPPTRTPALEDCHIAVTQGELVDAVFGSDLTYAQASELVRRALEVGFQGARIERTGCETFRVVVTGIPDDPAVQEDFRRETASVGFDVSFAPATRYPEVERGIPPVPS